MPLGPRRDAAADTTAPDTTAPGTAAKETTAPATTAPDTAASETTPREKTSLAKGAAETSPREKAASAPAPLGESTQDEPASESAADQWAGTWADDPVDDPADDPTDGPADDPADEESAPRARRRVGSRAATRLAVAATVVGVVAGAAGLYLRTEPGVTYSNQAYVDPATTAEVLRAAATASQRLVSIDHRGLDRYHDTLGEFLTPGLVAELDRNWPTLRSTYQQTKTVVTAKVSDVGLSFLGDDSAEVLVVQDVSMERDGQAAGSTTGTYLVTLTRVDGVWKLSKIPDLPS